MKSFALPTDGAVAESVVLSQGEPHPCCLLTPSACAIQRLRCDLQCFELTLGPPLPMIAVDVTVGA